MKSRRHKPLSVKVTRDGVLTIEIGIETMAFSALVSPFAEELVDDLTGRPGEHRPDKFYKITDARGFAVDVKRELLDEAEDGSSLLTSLLDDAARKTIEQGSEFFLGKDEEP